MLARAVDLAPDPVAIARALAEAPNARVALLHTVTRTGPSFVAAFPDDESASLDPADPMELVATSPLARAPRWIGVVPYDARRAGLERPAWSPRDERPATRFDRPRWLRYPAVVRVEAGRVLVLGRERAAVEDLAARLRGLRLVEARAFDVRTEDDEPLERHADRIRLAKELIACGDLYQVNLARRIRVRFRGGDPFSFHEHLSARAPAELAASLDLGDGLRVVSTSPELALRAEPHSERFRDRFGALLTAPIKGTRPRGADAASDEVLARALDEDPKERAELAMIVDVERNDLGRVATPGSVRVVRPPHVVSHRTVHHRLAWIRARAREDATREEVLAAMLPSGSVTGAPKIRAMEVIRALEPRRRGLYTGAFGFVGHDGGVTLAMAIRTVAFDGDDGEYWTGGGIVLDSDPAREVEETRWKAAQLARFFAGS